LKALANARRKRAERKWIGEGDRAVTTIWWKTAFLEQLANGATDRDVVSGEVVVPAKRNRSSIKSQGVYSQNMAESTIFGVLLRD